MITFERIPLAQLEPNTGQIQGLPANPRQWTDAEVRKLARSMKQTPQLAEARGCIVIPHGGSFVILGGNLRRQAAETIGWSDLMCAVMPEDTPAKVLREIVIKDNSSFGEWDLQALRKEWADAPLPEWGVDATWDVAGPDPTRDGTEQEAIDRMKREFEERMASGEISEEDEEYQEFLEKFKLKKTTDDCYTPEPVYDAVARYVEETYGVSRANFVRPFYPGGDYQAEKYPKGSVVVDNPPFSIMAEILRFYHDHGVRFFLFAPTLTLFSSSSGDLCTALPCGCPVIYENGANVNTSFLTNLEPEHIRFRSAPKLYAMVKEGVEEFTREIRKQLPKYSYPPHVITSKWVSALSRLGIDFVVPVDESEGISVLDSQRAHGKAIYGKGYIVSDAVKAEREKAEREKETTLLSWDLSDRELAIVERLNHHSRKAKS